MHITVKLYETEVNSIIRNSLLEKGLKVKGDMHYYSNSNGALNRLEVAVEMIEPEPHPEIKTEAIEIIGTKNEKALGNLTSYERTLMSKDLKVGDYVVVTYNSLPRVGKVVSLQKNPWGSLSASVEGVVTSSFKKGSSYRRIYSHVDLQKFDEKWMAEHLRKETDNWNKALQLVAKNMATGAEKPTRCDPSTG